MLRSIFAFYVERLFYFFQLRFEDIPGEGIRHDVCFVHFDEGLLSFFALLALQEVLESHLIELELLPPVHRVQSIRVEMKQFKRFLGLGVCFAGEVDLRHWLFEFLVFAFK